MLDSQEKIAEAKALNDKINELCSEEGGQVEMTHAVMVLAGMMTETLLEYEEPDVVMEQSVHRIADFLETNPVDGEFGVDELRRADEMDKYIEYGRDIARSSAERLPAFMDDLHEIDIALVLDAFPLWEKERGQDIDYSLRLFVEYVIAGLTFEMAVQEFCEMVIEEFITSGLSVNAALSVLAGIAGYYTGDVEAVSDLLPVIAKEAARHGVPGMRRWDGMESANDVIDDNLHVQIQDMHTNTEEFFAEIGLEDSFAKAVVMSKTVGRMMAVALLGDEDTHAHPTLSKSLVRTNLISGAKYRKNQEND